MTIEDRLRRALDDHTAEVPLPADRWDEIEQQAFAWRAVARRRNLRRAGGGLAAMGVAAAVAAALVIPAVVGGSGDRVSVRGPSATGTVAPGPGPTVTGPTGLSTPATGAPGSTSPARASGYQPLWPFAGLAEADSWQSSYRSGGHQPWHLDPAGTAVSFSRGFLGFSDIDTAFRTTMDGKGAHVTVGFRNPNGQPVNAAVVHLVRFGTGPTAPWEVVGTDDTPDFSLRTPAYGAVVGSTMPVGGVITGVDENIRVQAFQLSSSTQVGLACCLPAGGVSSPWRTTLTVHGATDQVLTITASTGGHLAAVERFAVTGVRTRSGPPAPGL